MPASPPDQYGPEWDEAGGDELSPTSVEADDGWYVLIQTSTDP